MFALIFKYGFEKAENRMNNFYIKREKLGKLKEIRSWAYNVDMQKVQHDKTISRTTWRKI